MGASYVANVYRETSCGLAELFQFFCQGGRGWGEEPALKVGCFRSPSKPASSSQARPAAVAASGAQVCDLLACQGYRWPVWSLGRGHDRVHISLVSGHVERCQSGIDRRQTPPTCVACVAFQPVSFKCCQGFWSGGGQAANLSQGLRGLDKAGPYLGGSQTGLVRFLELRIRNPCKTIAPGS